MAAPERFPGSDQGSTAALAAGVVVAVVSVAAVVGPLLGISPWLLLIAAALGGALTLIQRRLLPAIQNES